jgi:peptidyl-tRNA hydrolase
MASSPVSTGSTSPSSNMSSTELKMYFFINPSLKMKEGKVASQVAHITEKMITEIIINGYEVYPPSNLYMTYQQYLRESRIKIVLKSTFEEFQKLMTHPEARLFMDTGKSTQGTSGHITVIGFFPGANIDNIMSYKLYNS